MKCYVIAKLEITDPSWVRDYAANVTAIVERHGGRYLARTAQVEEIEGGRGVPHTLVLIQWPSREAADAFYTSEEYRPYRERRRAGARNEFVLVAGEDAAGLARIAD